MAALLRRARGRGGLGNVRTRGGQRQKQLVSPIPPSLRRGVADLAPRHRPMPSLHDRLREGKALPEPRRQPWMAGDQPPAAHDATTAPAGFAGSGRIWRLGTDHLDRDLAVKAYFCDPHSPWQKGAVENANGRVRRFLPRESPPEALARARLRRLADRLNDTPRRCLGYRTPREVFQQHLAAPTGPP